MRAQGELRRALANWQAPSFGMVVLMDLAVVIVVLLLLAPALISTFHDAMFRAELTEAFNVGSNARNAVIEQFAISGEPFEATGTVTAVAVPTAAEHLSGAAAARPRLTTTTPPPGAASTDDATDRVKAARRAQTELARQRESGEANTLSRYVRALRIEGAAIVVNGRMAGERGREYQLALVPAVLDGGVPQVVVWQCGRNQLPDGWTGPTPELVNRIPEHLLPSPCRDHRPAR